MWSNDVVATIDNCCGTWCYFRGREDEPCWGLIDCVDEDYADDDELRTWVHACEGHANSYKGPYLSMPEVNCDG